MTQALWYYCQQPLSSMRMVASIVGEAAASGYNSCHSPYHIPPSLFSPPTPSSLPTRLQPPATVSSPSPDSLLHASLPSPVPLRFRRTSICHCAISHPGSPFGSESVVYSSSPASPASLLPLFYPSLQFPSYLPTPLQCPSPRT